MAPSKGSGDKGAMQVNPSPNDKKQYRYIVLPNQLHALLISDPAIDLHEEDEEDEEGSGSLVGSADDDSGSDDGSRASHGDSPSVAQSGHRDGPGVAGGAKRLAAAAMAVGTGSFQDPDDLQGLSHYLEHMLFMGSEDFPRENEFDDYLVKSAGSSNAFTEAEFTNYHFHVKPACLHGALERFSAFFRKPLCLESALEREVQAVDSEFTGVMQDDQCRMLAMMCATARQGHPLRKFMWGNRRSLWDEPRAAGIAVRDRIVQHYERHYSASVMRLAVLGGESLDTLEDVVRSLFSPVADKGSEPLSICGSGFPFAGAPRLYMAPAIHEGHHVTVTFQLPPLLREFDRRADEYLGHLVGHEGPGSLLSGLKARGWATEITAGVGMDGLERNTACFLFSVQMTLTALGLEAGPGFGLAPVGLLFQYLRLLRDVGPQKWVWDEMKHQSDMRFRFKQELDSMETVTELAADMLLVPAHDLLQYRYLYRSWDEDLVRDVVGRLRPDSSGMRIDLQSSAFSDLRGPAREAFVDVESGTEQWFDLPFMAATLDPSQLDAWANAAPDDDLALPPRNPYVPTTFALLDSAPPNVAAGALTVPASLAQDSEDIVVPAGALLAPACLVDELGLRVLHKTVTAYDAPRGVVIYRLASPSLHGSAEGRAHLMLLVDCWNDALTELTYLADMSGLSSHITLDGPEGLEVSVSGFTDKLLSLAGAIWDGLLAMSASIPNWAAIRERRVQKASNALLCAQKHANWLRLRLIMTGTHDDADMLAGLSNATPSDVLAARAALLSECHVDVLAEGNLGSGDVLAAARSLRQRLGHGATATTATLRNSCVELPAHVAHRLCCPARNAEERNSVVQLYLQLGRTSVPLRAMQELLDQILSEPIYDTLRTHQQLGYSVSSHPTSTAGMLGFLVTVCSERRPSDVEAAIEAFLADFAGSLARMPDADFQRHKASLVALKLEACKNIAEAADLHWGPVWRQTFDFYEHYQVVEEVHKIDKDACVRAFESALAPGSRARRKLAVHVVAHQHADKAHATTRVGAPGGEHGVVEVHDIQATKAALPKVQQPIVNALRTSKQCTR